MRFVLIGLSFLLVHTYALAQTEDVYVHDPVMVKEGETFYLFCTGRGISMLSSPDLENWTKHDPVFSNSPEWIYDVVPDFRGHFWAPDIHYYNGKYYLYYSVSAFGKNTSAMGLVTNKTLDSKSPDYKWEDQGMIIQSIPGRDLWNAIDPNIAVDDEGYPWLAFGSFWSGIKMTKLIPNRTSLKEPQEWHSLARRERNAFAPDEKAGEAAIEAPFIFKKDSSYYLFVSWDYCCRGESSTYKVVLGKSDKITGPYLDRNGKSMAEGGGTLVVEGNKRYAGVGHNSAYTFDGKDYLVFHAYDLQDGGKPKLKIIELNWDEDGWPVADNSVLND